MPRTLIAFIIVAVTIGSVSAHDLFLKLDGYRLEPNARAIIRLFNGTFRESDGLVARERIRDVNVLGPEVGSQVDKISWRDETKTTVMELTRELPGLS